MCVLDIDSQGTVKKTTEENKNKNKNIARNSDVPLISVNKDCVLWSYNESPIYINLHAAILVMARMLMSSWKHESDWSVKQGSETPSGQRTGLPINGRIHKPSDVGRQQELCRLFH